MFFRKVSYKKMIQGYLTVYLSLSLTIILTLILTLIEGARINTARMEAECAADIGMNSVLAEFHRELLEQYDLFFVDMSYGTENPGIENSQEHLRVYIESNFLDRENKGKEQGVRDWLKLNADYALIPEYSIASDEGGSVMRRQAAAYAEESSFEGMLLGLADKAAEAERLGMDKRDIEGERSQIQGQINSIELPKVTDEKGEEHEIPLDNPADRVEEIKNRGILGIVLYDAADMSSAAADIREYISHRSRINGSGLPPKAELPDGISNKLLFQKYLMEKCGYYGKGQAKSLLKYQIEYILAGQNSDRENLERVVKRLLRWRQVTNTSYILTDTAKCAEAEALALTLTAVMQVPALVKPVKYSILYAWAYLESLCDVRCILKGGRLPIVKNGADWQTGIGSIANFAGNVPEREEKGEGLAYKDYLGIMLLMQEEEIQNMQTMDIMEMDIRRTRGNESFRMDACFDSFLADVGISGSFGGNIEVKKRYGYH